MIFIKRPLVWGTTSFILASLIALKADKALLIPLLGTAFALFAVFILIYLFTKNTFCGKFAFILFFLFMGFALFFLVHLPREEKAKSFDGFSGEVYAEVVQMERREYYTNAVVKTHRIGNENVRVKIKISLPFIDEEIKEGDGVKLSGEINTDFSTSLTFNSANYSAAREIFLKMDVESIEKTEGKTNPFRRSIYDFRKLCTKKLSSLDNTGLVLALVLGDKTQLPPEINADFQDLGLSHAIAVSGMHLSLIVMSLFLLLRRKGVGKYPLSISCILLTVFYMALTGFSFSITRAGIMMIMYFLSLLSHRKNDTLTTLFASVLFLCIHSTRSILDVGFQLSFVSTLGILVFVPKIIFKLENLKFFSCEKKDGFIEKCIYLLRKRIFELVILIINTVSALCAALPFTLIYFRSVAAFSIISNILVLFFINALLVLCIIHLVLSFIFVSPLSFVLAVTKFICDLLSNIVIFETDFLADLFLKPLHFPPEMSYTLAFLCAVFLVVFLFVKSTNALLYLFLCNVFSVLLFVLLGRFIFYPFPNVTMSVSKTCKDILIEEGNKTLLISSALDMSTSSEKLFEMLEYRSVLSIDEAVFLVEDTIPKEKIDGVMSVCEIDKIVIIPATSEIIENKSEFLRETKDKCVVEFCRSKTYKVTEFAEIITYADSFVCINIETERNKAVICHSIDKELFPAVSGLSSSDIAVIYGGVELPPKIKNAKLYLIEIGEDTFMPKGAVSASETQFCFIRFSKDDVFIKTIQK